MINVCGDCGFRKDCSAEEFMSHLWLHDEVEETMHDALVSMQGELRSWMNVPDEELNSSNYDLGDLI